MNTKNITKSFRKLNITIVVFLSYYRIEDLILIQV